MSYVSANRPRKAHTARHGVPAVPTLVGYGAYAVAFCFTTAVVLGLVP